MTASVVWILAWRLLLQWIGVPPENLFNAGHRHYQAGEYALAEQAFARAAHANRLEARAAYNAGNAAFQLERYADAVRWYERAVNLAPEDEDAWHNLELAQRRITPKPDIQVPPRDQSGARKTLAGRNLTPGRSGPTQGTKPADGPLTPQDIERLLRESREQETSLAPYFRPWPLRRTPDRSRDIFTMSPDDLLSMLREQIREGYPYPRRRETVHERRLEDRRDW